MEKFFKLDFKKIRKLQEGGRLLRVENTLQLVLVEQSLVVVRIYLLLMTPIQSKTRCPPMHLRIVMSGTPLAQDNVFNQEDRSYW